MMKRNIFTVLLFLSGIVLSALLLQGCARRIAYLPNTVAPGVENRAYAVHCRAECYLPDAPKNFYLVMDGSASAMQYASDLKGYSINALKYLGFRECSNERSADIIVKVGFSRTENKRMRLEYTMTAWVKGRAAWSVNSFITSRIGDARCYLPGLVAGTLNCIGKNKVSMTNLRKYPEMINAVVTTAKQELLSH